MKIGVLGWGSLVWDPRELAVADEFSLTGPTLPIEFCRISGTQKPPRRLTLVIDDAIGADCQSYVARSAFEDLDAARENLRAREGLTHVNGIGYAVTGGDKSVRAYQRHPKAVEVIDAWLADSDVDAVIWTALASNFMKHAAEAFSVEAAIRFLEALPEGDLPVALEYVRNAPPPIQTSVRAAVSARWPHL